MNRGPNPGLLVSVLLMPVGLASLAETASHERSTQDAPPTEARQYGEVGPTWSPDGPHIAFVSSISGSRQIYRVNAGGGTPIRLTHRDDGFDSEPSWSPDGSRIAFVSDRGATISIHTMAPDGSDVRRLTDDDGNDVGHVAWSPDGAAIIFRSDRAFGRVEPERLADGRIKIRDADTELHRLTLATGTIDRLSNNRTWELVHVGAWSPGGERFVFSSGRANESGDLFIADQDGKVISQLTNDGSYYYPSWSPDGSTIAYLTRNNVEKTEIFVMSVDGSERRRLTFAPGYDQDPAWSPDGSQIAFSSQRSGATRLYLMKADGSDIRRLIPEHFAK